MQNLDNKGVTAFFVGLVSLSVRAGPSSLGFYSLVCAYGAKLSAKLI
jgi:hypothetical protein